MNTFVSLCVIGGLSLGSLCYAQHMDNDAKKKVIKDLDNLLALNRSAETKVINAAISKLNSAGRDPSAAYDLLIQSKKFLMEAEKEKDKSQGKSAKALIVIGGTSVRRLGYLDRVQALLKNQGVESVVFDKVQPNPVVEHVMEAAALARETGCDFVVGLGGGSSMDSAKSIAVMAANPGTYWDYIQGGSGKGLPIPNKPLPIVCITTTAGTGTEADPWTVITKEDTQEKIGFGFKGTFPTMSIVDPELMLSVPPKLTAYQGFDALFHAVEGYMATIASPMGDMFALQAIEYIAKYLPRAVSNGDDLEARAYVALANTYSGFVETISCCTSEHSIEHALSAFHPALPHGAGLIMISWAYHEAYATACPERYARVAAAMGQEASVDGFLNGLNKLKEACGVDKLKMSEFGITPDLFDEYARTAFSTMGNLFELDRCKFTPADVVSILEKSYS